MTWNVLPVRYERNHCRTTPRRPNWRSNRSIRRSWSTVSNAAVSKHKLFRPKLFMSFLTQSHQSFLWHPLCLIPSTSHVIQRLTQSISSFHSTCPNYLNLLFLIIKPSGSNPKSSQSSPLFFLSFNLTPHIHLTILVSCAIQLQLCHTFIGQVSSHK